MNRIVLLFALVIVAITSSFAQTQDTIIEVKNGAKITYLISGETLSGKKVLDKMKSCPDAYKEMKRYRTNKTFGTLFALTGGVIVGLSLGGRMPRRNPKDDTIWVIAGFGATIVASGIPFYIAAPMRRRRAIKLYNNHILHEKDQCLEFRFGATNYGIGLSVNF